MAKPSKALRAGSTETPTVDGHYWFNGHIDRASGRYRVEDILDVGLGWANSEPLSQFKGRWWGPLVAPWEEKDKSDEQAK